MLELSSQQIRYFRLCSHHLDRTYRKEDCLAVAGACGLQNSPPGAWETALYTRIPELSPAQMDGLLYRVHFAACHTYSGRTDDYRQKYSG